MGRVEDYGEFQEILRSLVDKLYTELLKNQLTEESSNMLRGVIDRKEAWWVLDIYYGNKNATAHGHRKLLAQVAPSEVPRL